MSEPMTSVSDDTALTYTYEDCAVFTLLATTLGITPKDFRELLEARVIRLTGHTTKEGYALVDIESVAQYFYQVLRAVAYEVVMEVLNPTEPEEDDDAWTNDRATRRSARDSLRLQRPPTS